jgi:hypothetical protein
MPITADQLTVIGRGQLPETDVDELVRADDSGTMLVRAAQADPFARRLARDMGRVRAAVRRRVAGVLALAGDYAGRATGGRSGSGRRRAAGASARRRRQPFFAMRWRSPRTASRQLRRRSAMPPTSTQSCW